VTDEREGKQSRTGENKAELDGSSRTYPVSQEPANGVAYCARHTEGQQDEGHSLGVDAEAGGEQR
jgi:hypothetical protein